MALGGRIKEVFFGQAEKVDIDPSSGFRLPFDSKDEADEYVEGILTDSLKPNELESLKNNGIPFGTWARYRNLYKWIPSYTENKLATDKRMSVDYLNGESDWAPTYFSSDVDVVARPLPRNISFSVNMGDESVLYIIHFEEFELMEAFEKLGANGEKVYLEFDPQLPRLNTKVRVRNDKEIIELKKTVTEDW